MQNIQKLLNIQNMQNVQNVQNMQNTQNMQNMQNLQNMQSMPKMPNMLNMQNMQNMQDMQNKEVNSWVRCACLAILIMPSYYFLEWRFWPLNNPYSGGYRNPPTIFFMHPSISLIGTKSELFLNLTFGKFKLNKCDAKRFIFLTRGERYIETIASLDQWSITIENH